MLYGCFYKSITVELRYNEPLYNKILGITNITNDFLYPSNDKIYEKEPRYSETSWMRRVSPLALRYIYRGSTVFSRLLTDVKFSIKIDGRR